MNIENKMKLLNIELPNNLRKSPKFSSYVRTGNLVYLSGQGPFLEDGGIITGKVGKDLSKEKAYDAARICGLNLLAVLKEAVGNLENVARIVSINGFVNSTDDFYEQSYVINGVSDLVNEIFGEKGKHSRCAVSANSLPMNFCVEVVMIAEIKDNN